MGTTQRINPNWGSLSVAVTSIAKAEKEIAQLEVLDEGDGVQDENIDIEAQLRKLKKRRDNHLKSVVDRLVGIGGGSRAIASGRSAKVGRAGVRSASRLASFFSRSSSIGIEGALAEIGFATLIGKSLQDVLDYIINYCCDSDVGMDEAAAKTAMNEILKKFSQEANGEIDLLNNMMREAANGNALGNLLCDFFGIYIYEFLWERLEERLRQIRGKEVAKSTFESIKREIDGRVRLLNESRPVAQIDWAGNEGQIEIERIFTAIIQIEGE